MSFSWNYFALTTKNGSYNAIQSSPRTRCYSPVKWHFNKYAFSLVKNNIFFKNNKVLTSQTVAILYVNVCIVLLCLFLVVLFVCWCSMGCDHVHWSQQNSCTSGFYVWFLFCVYNNNALWHAIFFCVCCFVHFILSLDGLHRFVVC